MPLRCLTDKADPRQENSAPAIQGDLVVWQHTLMDGAHSHSLKGHWLPSGETFTLLDGAGSKPIDPEFELDGTISYRVFPGTARHTIPIPVKEGMSTDPLPKKWSVWKTDHNHLWAEVIPEPSSLVLLTMGSLALLAYAWRRRRAA